MKPPVTLAQLAEAVPGASVIGDETIAVERLVAPNAIQSPADITLIMSAGVAEALSAVPQLPIQAAVIGSAIADDFPALTDRLAGCLLVERPRYSLAALARVFGPEPEVDPGIHPSAVIHETARVDPSCSIGPNVSIGPRAVVGANTILMANTTVREDAVIGADCLLHPGVRIGPRVLVGDRVIMQPNACVGSDGFSFVTEEESSVEATRAGRKVEPGFKGDAQIRIDSLGNVVIEDDVEIGAGTTIDLATLGECRVKKGTKIDNLVQIGHNNVVGENCLICAQVGISGSCTIGDGVVLAGKVGLADHLKVDNGAIIMAKSGVMKNVDAGSVQFGTPAQEARSAFKSLAGVARLDEMRAQLRKLKKQVADLTEALADDSPGS